MLKFFQPSRREIDFWQRLAALLPMSPGGPDRLRKDFPEFKKLAKEDSSVEYKMDAAAAAATLIIGAYLDAQPREALREYQAQYSTIDLGEFKREFAERAQKDSYEDHGFSFNADYPVIFALSTLASAELFAIAGTLSEHQFSRLKQEIDGAFKGVPREKRSVQWVHDSLYDAIGITPVAVGNDESTFYVEVDDVDIQHFAKRDFERKVRVEETGRGRILVDSETNESITQKRSLKQEELAAAKIGTNTYTFVNVTLGQEKEIVSCLIPDDETEEFIGNRRAFWWSLARGVLRTTTAKIKARRFNREGFDLMCSHASIMWEIAIEKEGSISQMRDVMIFSRNVHLEVFQKMREQAESESERLGIDIATAMVLATQCEDSTVERMAFRALKQFLWLPGEEPDEFAVYC